MKRPRQLKRAESWSASHESWSIPDENEEEKEDDNNHSQKKLKADALPICRYDGRCYRLNRSHWEQYQHPSQARPRASSSSPLHFSSCSLSVSSADSLSSIARPSADDWNIGPNESIHEEKTALHASLSSPTSLVSSFSSSPISSSTSFSLSSSLSLRKLTAKDRKKSVLIPPTHVPLSLPSSSSSYSSPFSSSRFEQLSRLFPPLPSFFAGLECVIFGTISEDIVRHAQKAWIAFDGDWSQRPSVSTTHILVDSKQTGNAELKECMQRAPNAVVVRIGWILKCASAKCLLSEQEHGFAVEL
eukprot:TRINITY_DN65_c0_g3_i1.p1 TRINITY_DN65_c0_g3~~TRINITY_DN65_c0_g3_i1.p1  ORF type:complete len:302 (+),score=75.08 TRINITY_DN65_c0_g3_i1:99-1004(+)